MMKSQVKIQTHKDGHITLSFYAINFAHIMVDIVTIVDSKNISLLPMAKI